MQRLVFIDDDEEELKSMERLVAGAYRYVPVHWPHQRPTQMHIGKPPAIFVSDLYLPPPDQGRGPKDLPRMVLQAHAVRAKRVGKCFRKLFPGPEDAKKRLKKTDRGWR